MVWFRLLAVLGCAVLLQACLPSQTLTDVFVRNPYKEVRPLAAIRDGSVDPALRDLSQYALLAAAAYGDPDFASGRGCPLRPMGSSRWQRVDGYSEATLPRDPENSRIRIPGIGYQLWRDLGAKGRKRLALVFRGTDSGQWGDWYSNARWLTRLNPLTWDQYGQTRDLMKKLIPELDRRFGKENYELVSVGHSLGGGLAQHAAYVTPVIRAVYAFDTSPVTASTSIDPAVKRRYRAGLAIYRIYESGEVLSSLRWASRQVVPLSGSNPRIAELRFNFRSTLRVDGKDSGPIAEHSIRQLACDLVCYVDRNGDPATCRRPTR